MDELQVLSILKERIINGCISHVNDIKMATDKKSDIYHTIRSLENELELLDELQSDRVCQSCGKFGTVIKEDELSEMLLCKVCYTDYTTKLDKEMKEQKSLL